jgi:acyl dehydratase
MNPEPAQLVATTLDVAQEMLVAYGPLTRDSNPIHLDEAFARTTAYGRRIAHGTLSLNALWRAIDATFPPEVAARVAIDVRFTAPVFVGEQLMANGERTAVGVYAVRVKAADRVVISGTLTLGPADRETGPG